MHDVPPDRRAQKGLFAAKLSSTEAHDIRRRHLAGETLTRLAAEFGVTIGALSRIVNGHSYRDCAARIALKLSAEAAVALARLESRTGLPRRRLAEDVFERGLAALERELPE